MMETKLSSPGMGICRAHGMTVEVNGKATCLVCEASPAPSGLTVQKRGVTQEDIDQLPPINPDTQKPVYKTAKTMGNAGIPEALTILSSIPAPKAIKDYKKLVKAISLLEELQNGAN